MIELLPDFFRGIISTTMNALLLITLLQPRYSKKVTTFTILGMLFINSGVAIYCYVTGNLTMLAKLGMVVFTVLCFVVKPLFKDTFMQWLFSYITVHNISYMVVVLSFILSRHLPHPVYGNVVIRFLLLLFFYWLLRFYVRPLYRQMLEHWNVFFYVALAVYASYVYYIVITEDIVATLKTQAMPLLLITAIAVAAYISVFHLLATLSREHLLREEKQRSDRRQELLQTELAALESYVNLARQNRHDLRHHNALLAEYLEQGDVAGAKEYLYQHNIRLTEAGFKQYCKNPVVNAVLRIYSRRAENSGISFIVEANVPEELPLSAPEINELFSNLLENACEACEKVDGGSIDLTVQVEDDRLLLELRNSMAVKTAFNESGLPLTTKEGGGAGAKSACSIVEKVGGMLRFSQEGEEFVTQMILPLV